MPFKVANFVVAHTKSLDTFFSGTAKASPSSSAEVEYLHPIVEMETLKGFESHDTMNSYETEEYQGLVQEKGIVLTNAAAAVRSFEHQVCRYRED